MVFLLLNLKKYMKEVLPLTSNRRKSITGAFVNLLMKQGKKEKALNFFLNALFFMKKKQKKNEREEPFFLINKALNRVKPLVGLKIIRRRNRKVLVPYMLSESNRERYAIRWLIESAKQRNKKGKSISESLCDEILDSSKGQGMSIKKKEDLHTKALENKFSLRFWS